MSPDEFYCQIGCFQGGSLIAAMLDHSEITAVAVDDVSEFDIFGDSWEILAENLAVFNLEYRVWFCDRNFE